MFNPLNCLMTEACAGLFAVSSSIGEVSNKSMNADIADCDVNV